MKWMLAALAASSAPQEHCELHIWAAFATGSQTAGWLSNLGIAGALQDYERNKDERLRSQAALIVALPPQRQAAVINAMNVQRELGLDPARLVFERGSIDAKEAKHSRGRLASSGAACYAELIVSRNIYKASPLHGQTLSTELAFRDFRNGRTRIVSRTETVRLKETERPPDEPAVAVAFETNVRAFVERQRRLLKRR